MIDTMKMSEVMGNKAFLQDLRRLKKEFPKAAISRPRGRDAESFGYKTDTGLEISFAKAVEIEGKRFWIPKGTTNEEMFLFIYEEIYREDSYTCETVTIHPGDVVVDCGANVGLFTKIALEKGAAKVIAIEPEERNFSCLVLNLQEEILNGKVIPIRACVGHEAGTVQLAVSEYFTSHAVNKNSDIEGGSELIPVTTVDILLKELGEETLNYLKMDIEGYERHALRGAADRIAQDQPRMAICAYHYEDCNSVIQAMIKEFHDGYTVDCKELELTEDTYVLRPKVLFFQAQS